MPELSQTTTLPLFGQRILVTRTREQASTLSERLSALGAIPIEFPTIRIVPPTNWTELDSALKRLFGHGYPGDGGYTWLIFTSANAVNICCERLLTLGYNLSAIHNVRIATIGPATAAALTRYGLTADLIPDEYRAEGVATAIIEDFQRRGEPIVGKRILLPRAAEARKILVTELQQAGAIVDEIVAYYTHSASSDDVQGQATLRRLQAGELDILTFTSSSTVRNFMQWLLDCEEQGIAQATHLVTQNPHLQIACIGPITAQTARECGLTVTIEATMFTIDGLIEAIVQSI